jgi:lipoprotein-releasing system permease protein
MGSNYLRQYPGRCQSQSELDMLFLALKHIFSKKKQSLLILSGITLGASAFVLISGFMGGFQNYLLQQLIYNTAQIDISAKEHYITPNIVTPSLFSKKTLVDWQTQPSGVREFKRIIYPYGWYQKLDNDKRVVAYTPQLDVNAIISHGSENKNITITGTIPKNQVKVTNVANYLVSGSFKQLKQGSYNIIVGEGLANKIGATLNNTVYLSSASGTKLPFKIVGIFKFGIKMLDDTIAYAALSDTQNLDQSPGKITNIAVRVNDPYIANTIAQQWKSFAADNVKSWQTINANFLSVITVQNMVKYSMSGAILLVAGFGVYNILNMMITHKRREVAILRAIGYTGKDITLLFFKQGLIYGVIGGIIGVIIGYLGCLYLSTLPAVGNMSAKNNRLLIDFNHTIYIKGFLLAFVSSAFSSFFPSLSAGRMTPIEIIRSEDNG